MSKKSTTGSAPEPSADLWIDMKNHGKVVADEVRMAKRYGGSSNPRSKIITGLRWALNQGIDNWERSNGHFTRPSKKEVTNWATYTAGEVMDKTAWDRKNGRLYEFGFAAATAMKLAYKKGWSLAAGNTTLTGHLVDAAVVDQNVAIPPKYKDQFILFAFCFCKEHEHRRQLALRPSGYTPRGKPIYRSIVIKAVEKGFTVTPYDRHSDNSFSDGAVQALVRRDLLRPRQEELVDGSVFETVELTLKGMHAAIAQTRQDAVNERKNTEKRRRDTEAFLRANPDQAHLFAGLRDFDSLSPAEKMIQTFDAFLARHEANLQAEAMEASEGPSS